MKKKEESPAVTHVEGERMTIRIGIGVEAADAEA